MKQALRRGVETAEEKTRPRRYYSRIIVKNMAPKWWMMTVPGTIYDYHDILNDIPSFSTVNGGTRRDLVTAGAGCSPPEPEVQRPPGPFLS